MTSPPVVVLGFDAMDPTIARSLAEAGRLPTFRSFFEDGATAAVGSPPGLVVGSVWPSFWTGVWPSEHGFYCFVQLVNGTYTVRRFNSDDVDGVPFWMTLARAGQRVAAVDVPICPLTCPDDGVHVVDWGTHDRMHDPTAWPHAMTSTIGDLVGHHAVRGKCDDYTERGAFSQLLHDLQLGIDQRTNLCLDLLHREAWDCFVAVYGESHCVAHQLWWAHDPEHPRHVEQQKDPIEQIYEALDAALARVVEALAPDATVLVLLSHGVGQHHDAEHLLAEILRRLDDAYGPRPRWLVRREQLLRRLDRARARRRLEPWRAASVSSVDSSRRFFKVPNNEHDGAVRINRRGREPRGRVADGPELDALLTWLERELCSLRDPDTNRPLVRTILRAADVYSGARLDDLPDLLIDWERSAPITAAASERIGVVRGRYTGLRSADHRPGGLLLVRGPHIEPGSLGSIGMVDIAPTVCALRGQPLARTDGTSIAALTESAQR